MKAGKRSNIRGESKYLGKEYEGRWVVVDMQRVHHYTNKFILENKYNHRRIELLDGQILKVEKGEITISSLISHRLSRQGLNKRFCGKVSKDRYKGILKGEYND